MGWHYVDGAGQQSGPVDEESFRGLLRDGGITAETLVWREGMSEWKSYGTIAAPGATVVCSVSGKSVPKDEAIQIGDKWVSAEHKNEYLQKIKEGVPLPGIVRYAGFWIRFGAKIIDGLILVVPSTIVQIAGTFLMKDSLKAAQAAGPNPFAALPGIGLIFFINISISIGYYVFFVGRFGATPGKMACGLRIVRAGGAPLGYGLAAGRFFAEFVSMLTLYIGYIMIAFDDEKRALHDRICGTRVVRKS